MPYTVLSGTKHTLCGVHALPGGSSRFAKSEPKSTRGFAPWTPGFIISARKDTLLLLSFPFVPAIEQLNRQRLRRNYERALNPGFCGDITCDNCQRPFLLDHLPRPGYFIFLVQQLQEAAFITHLKLLYRACQVSYSLRVQGPQALVLSVRFPESGLPPGRA